MKLTFQYITGSIDSPTLHKALTGTKDAEHADEDIWPMINMKCSVSLSSAMDDDIFGNPCSIIEISIMNKSWRDPEGDERIYINLSLKRDQLIYLKNFIEAHLATHEI